MYGAASAASGVGSATLNQSAEAMDEHAERLVAGLETDLDECRDSLNTAKWENSTLLTRLDYIKSKEIVLNNRWKREERKARELEMRMRTLSSEFHKCQALLITAEHKNVALQMRMKTLSSQNEFFNNFHTLISRLCSRSEVFFIIKVKWRLKYYSFSVAL